MVNSWIQFLVVISYNFIYNFIYCVKAHHCQFLMKAAVVLWCKLVVRAVQ